MSEVDVSRHDRFSATERTQLLSLALDYVPVSEDASLHVQADGATGRVWIVSRANADVALHELYDDLHASEARVSVLEAALREIAAISADRKMHDSALIRRAEAFNDAQDIARVALAAAGTPEEQTFPSTGSRWNVEGCTCPHAQPNASGSPVRGPWVDCETCLAHFAANRDGVIHAAASVGIEHGLTSNQALDLYYKERHEQHA